MVDVSNINYSDDKTLLIQSYSSWVCKRQKTWIALLVKIKLSIPYLSKFEIIISGGGIVDPNEVVPEMECKFDHMTCVY